MVAEGNEKLEQTKTSVKQGSQAKQPEETPEIAAAVEYLRTRLGMTNHDIQDALSTYCTV